MKLFARASPRKGGRKFRLGWKLGLVALPLIAGFGVLMFYAAANYDPERFPDPERVDIERSPNPHTSFGLSSHRCIGMHFARLELDVVLREVLKRMPDCKVDHDGARRNADVGVNQGWVKLPIRWTVERTFAWLGKCRRLSKDREKSVRSSEAFVKLAMIHLMLNRLEPKDADAEFQYRTAA